MRNRSLLALLLAILVAPLSVTAQITVPNPTFVVDTVIDPDQVNANFAKFADALNRTGGTMTGTLTMQALVDLSHASAGQIKFPASQNASANANTLDDYEEGPWTPSDGSGAGLTLSSTSAAYVKIGQQVTAWAEFTYPVTANGSSVRINGLPAPTHTTPTNGGSCALGFTDVGFIVTAQAVGSSIFLYDTSGSNQINSAFSGKSFRLTCTYRASS